MTKILVTNLVLILFVSGLSVAEAASFTPPIRKIGSTIVSVVKYGAVGIDRKDDTLAFQKAIDALPASGGTVVVPAGNYIIDGTKGIDLRSNLHLKMDANAVLQESPNAIDNSRMFRAEQLHDLEISGGQLIGDRDHHLGTTGESGHAISMNGAIHATIRNVKISKFWGDGLYIGAWQHTPVQYSHDVVIYQVVSTQNRRQAMSITNAEYIRVYNSEFSYTEGTAPQFGIDIEPNQISTSDNNSRYAKNIEIVGCRIHHNKGGGVQYFRQVYSTTLSQNDISYNRYGLFSVESYNTVATGNTFSHNQQKAISFHPDSDNMTVSGNIFRNNSTDQFGITNDKNPLVTVVGQSSLTAPHVGVMAGSGVFVIKSNQYAK